MMTINGVSTCKVGEEQFETFSPSHRPKQKFVQYDYRHPDGRLFSCVAQTLDECRDRRDKWLAEKR